MKNLLWLQLMFSEMRGNRSFCVTFILNLSLGLIGFLVLDSFKSSVQSSLADRSRAILAADISVSARRPLTDTEQKKIISITPQGAKRRYEVNLFTMAASSSGTRLVEVRAVDNNFPFYGEISLKSGAVISPGTPKAITQSPRAWIYPELAVQLGVQVGDRIKIGETHFTVDDLIESDPSVSSISFAAAPKVYLGLPYLENTGLMGTGSRLQQTAFYKVNENIDLDAFALVLAKELSATDIRITPHDKASEQLGRILLYLNDYLGLVALVALFLAGVGAAYLFRSFLTQRCKDIAILGSLGLAQKTTFRLYLSLLVFLGLVSTLITLALGYFVLPVLVGVFGDLMVSGMKVTIPIESVILAFFIGTLGCLLFCLPILLRLRSLNPSILFREDAQPNIEFTKKSAIGWFPVVAVYWLLAIWQSNSLKTGSLFIVLFLVSALMLSGICLAFFLLTQKLNYYHPRIFARYFALINLTRYRLSTLTCFLAIGLGSLLINLVPQIRNVLDRELAPGSGKVPSLFMFDIQDEQVTPLEEQIDGFQTRLNYLSPMIMARFTHLNGIDVDAHQNLNKDIQSRESERADRMRNRTYNLSYREQLASSEAIIDGMPFSGPFDWDSDNLPEISLEKRFAERLGIQIDDTMTFDVQGVEVKGRVINFRRVKWTSFHPNFFVLFQPGVLDDAPKTFVASVPDLDFYEKITVQNAIVQAFPNISIIDVTQTIERILNIVTQVTAVIDFMAYLTLIAGFAVLFSIVRHQTQSRASDFNLLKILGTSFGDIKKMAMIEFGLLGFLAGTFGASISIGVSYVVAYFVFDSAWIFSAEVPVLSSLVITSMTIAIGFLASYTVLTKRPRELLT